MKKWIKYGAFSGWIFFLGILFSAVTARAEDIHLVLDPGHGASQSGAENEASGTLEKNVNLKIGLYLRDILEEDYDGVTVSMTREGDDELDLDDRAELAVEEEADAFISLHNNAVGDIAEYTDGCTVLVAYGTYREELTQITQELGVNILYELKQLGIEDRGLMLRTSQSGETYDNGELADYYGLVRRGVRNNIPSIIIEHSFIDDSEDFAHYLSSDEELKALAEADARGIARYYQLPEKSTGQPLEKLANVTEEKVYITTGHWQDNEVWEEVFFPAEEQKNLPENPWRWNLPELLLR